MRLVNWNYCKNLNEIDNAIRNPDENWYGITAENIISITYNSNLVSYVVFWRYEEDIVT